MMRRKDREVTDAAEIKSVVERAKVVHLGMVDGKRPYVVPLHYGCEWDGEALTLWCHGAREGRKLDVLRENSAVFAEIDCDMELDDGGVVACSWGSYYASVMGDDIATIVEDTEEKIRGLQCLMRTQTGRDFDILPQMAASVAVIRILALNPYLMIPFILSATISMAVGYGLTMAHVFGRFFAALPWATPPFLLGPLGTGDIKTALLPVIAFVIGLVIYLPFWRVYEKKCLEEEAANEAEAA